MAEPLKNHFGHEVPARIAAMIRAVHPSFPAQAFIAESLQGYEPLGLTQRGWQIAHALRHHLPSDYAEAIAILLASLGPRPNTLADTSMASFLYMPHTFFVAEYGLEHFDLSMKAQYELTKRFTAEFSIRPYLIRFPEATLAQLERWATDPCEHVRRLISEGTRPRLPWAMRLPAFQRDPSPVLALLEKLKDDPSLYVRRSVANHLNDIGKDHPGLLVQTTQQWQKDATTERQWLIRHALRTAVKRGDAGALATLGYGSEARASIRDAAISPPAAKIGGGISIAFDVMNEGTKPQRLMVDFQVHYVKANGKTSAKVFKLREIELGPKATLRLSKNVSLREMTTRKHYPGVHRVDAILNGQVIALGEFDLGHQ